MDKAMEQNPNWRGGTTKHWLNQRYLDMIGRCYRPTHLRYADYGGRGITVCDRWRKSFWNYVADLSEPPFEGRATVERIDNNGNYEPENIKWATYYQQAYNKRDYANKYDAPGVRFSPSARVRQWQARITVDGKRMSLGYFETKEEAIKARSEAVEERREFYDLLD